MPNRPPGFFVEVGANEPRHGSQTWQFEQAGWNGVLVEPQPELAERLRAARRARIVAAACSSPANAGGKMTLFLSGPHSSLKRDLVVTGVVPHGTIEVPARTLDDILVEAGAPTPIDFVSIDVEGHEVDVLSGFDLARWRPRLILDRRPCFEPGDASLPDARRLSVDPPHRPERLVRAAVGRLRASGSAGGSSRANTISRCRSACCATASGDGAIGCANGSVSAPGGLIRVRLTRS